MNNLRFLLKIQLLNWFGINKAIHSHDKNEKRKLIGFIILVVFVGISISLTSFAYSWLMSYAFIEIGAMELLLAIMMAVICLMTLFTTIYKTKGLLFGFKDYDILMSMPIKTSIIVASRLMMLYITNLFFAAFIMLPAGIVYAIKTSPSFEFYIIFIITFFVIPMLPIIIATIIGSLIAWVSSKFKRNNIANIILTILFFIFVMIISFVVQFSIQLAPEKMADIALEMIGMLNKLYPLTNIYIQAVCDYNIISLLIFIIISFGAFVIFSMFIGWKFKDINTVLSTVKITGNYKLTSLKQSTPFVALYKKELRKYFSSSIYVLNTAIGVIFSTIMTFGILFFGSESIEQILEMPGFTDNIKIIAPLAIAGLSAMSCSTACSISLEGKSLWIIKSIPINIKDIFMSKIAVNLTILIPLNIINGIILSIVLNLSPVQMLIMFITPAVYSIFISLFGLLMNLFYPSFTWESEAVVIKRSASITISVFVGMISIIIPAILLFVLPFDLFLIVGVVTLVMAIIDIVLYKIIFTKGVNIFYSL